MRAPCVVVRSRREVALLNPSLTMRPRRHPDSAYKSIAGEGGLVVLPGKAEVKVLNPTGVHIFSLLDGEHSLEEIARSIFEEYEVPMDSARRDVQEFVAALGAQGMLAMDAETEAQGTPS